MKKFKPVAWTIFVVIIGLLIIKNPIAKHKFEKAISQITGVPVSMQFLSLSFEGGDIEITNLNLLNDGEVVFPVSKVFLDFDRLSIFSKKPKFEKVRADMGSVLIVRNADGTTNLDHFVPLAAQADLPQFHIDDFRLRIGGVNFIDEHKKISLHEAIKIDYSASFKNVSGSKVLMSIILYQALTQSGLAKKTKYRYLES